MPGAAAGEETAAALPQDIPRATLFLSGYLTRVLKHGDGNACIITKLVPRQAQWPRAWVRQDNALCGRTLPMDAAVKVSLLTHCSGSGQKVGDIDHQTLNSSSRPSTVG